MSTPIPLIGVILQAQVDPSGLRFSIPQGYLDQLGLKDGDEVELVIQRPGKPELELFRGKTRLTGNRIEGPKNLMDKLVANEMISLHVLKPSKY